MNTKATHSRKWILSAFAGLIYILTWGTMAWASTRFGEDIEVQAWFRTRNTFQTDSKHFDWVQWRNEAYVWFIDNGLVKNGNVLGSDVPFPLAESAALSARFRARVDPVYYLREHYRKLYDAHHRTDWFNPERDFRDLYVDMDHGKIGPGRLSSRIGYQQIVWGESDLYRSLDIINPLRVDQNFGAGEKFDEFRFPLLAFKLLYNIGDVGQFFSNVSIESFYTPRWFSGSKSLLLEDGWRIEYQIKNCVGPNGQLLDYSPENCANSRKFLPYRANWLGERRAGHPWSIFPVGPVAKIESPDFACATQRCAADVAGDRISVIYNIMKGSGTHHTRGSNWGGLNNAAGVRTFGTTRIGVDFSLNYIFLPTGPLGDGRIIPRAPAVFGDSAFNGIQPSGTFEEGLRECLSDSGKSSTKKHPGRTIFLTGADLRGYDFPGRRLDAKGNPLPSAKQKQAARVPVTICAATPKHTYQYTHVAGITATYNDFEYTGAVWRLEESVSSNEGLNRYPVGYGGAHPTNPGRTAFHWQPVWRSMIGFDLLSSLMSYPGMKWTKNLPGDFGTQASFLSFQWLMKYQPSSSNTFCEWNNAVGIGPSLPSEGLPVRPAQSGCRDNHWNHLLTLGFAGQGYFKSKLEQRTAVVLEPRGKQFLLFGQWWWRNFYDTPIDLSMGVAWFPNSRMDNSWSLLNYFTNRNQIWLEATYYLL